MSYAFMPEIDGFMSLGQRARTFLPEIIGTTISGGGAIASWQAQAQWAVSIAAGLGSLAAALLTIRSLLKRNAKKP